MARKAKIVCTLGPASADVATIGRLLEAGMDVARLNFSHGTHDDHREIFENVHRAADRLGRNVAVLQDLQGPRIRVGGLAGRPVDLAAGRRFRLTTRDVPGDAACVSTTYESLPQDLSPGDAVLLDDGLLRLRVIETTSTDVYCEVVHGGKLSAHKGLNLPGVDVSAPSLTDKDREDLAVGLELGVDWVALSFVRAADEVRETQELIRERGSSTPVIAKLEKPEAVRSLDEILGVADGVMVARGDLGVELPPERVPVLQKEIIRRANCAKLPVITATQMLESMTHRPQPTRAEASDVANAIYDGTDAVMLSGETAIGDYPVETVAMMDRIVCEAEADDALALRAVHVDQTTSTFPEAIAEAAAEAADDLNAKLIVGFTQSGGTGRLLSKYRPSVPLIVFAHDEAVRRRMALLWGIEAREIDSLCDTEEMITSVERRLLGDATVTPGDTLVVVSGSPVAARGMTNSMKLHRVGEG